MQIRLLRSLSAQQNLEKKETAHNLAARFVKILLIMLGKLIIIIIIFKIYFYILLHSISYLFSFIAHLSIQILARYKFFKSYRIVYVPMDNIKKYVCKILDPYSNLTLIIS